jgi:hypothetical protein
MGYGPSGIMDAILRTIRDLDRRGYIPRRLYFPEQYLAALTSFAVKEQGLGESSKESDGTRMWLFGLPVSEGSLPLVEFRGGAGVVEFEEIDVPSLGHRGIKTHFLKTWPEAFYAVAEGIKNFEWRKNDRDFQVGDTVVLRMYDPDTKEYLSAPPIRKKTTFMLYGPQFSIPEGYCIMQLRECEECGGC